MTKEKYGNDMTKVLFSTKISKNIKKTLGESRNLKEYSE